MGERSTAELRGKNIVIYDLEIKNIIGSEVNGQKITWATHGLMGISVGCLFDYRDGDNKVYLDDNVAELRDRLNSADLVVAFNHINFDNRLMDGCGYKLREDLPCYDMLIESRKSLGWKVGSNAFPKGCKLDNHLLGTFGAHMVKTASGEEAPKMYQAGQMGRLISYCLADVRRERMLFEHIWKTGTVATNTHGSRTVKHPEICLIERMSEEERRAIQHEDQTGAHTATV